MIQLNYRDARPIYEQIKAGLRRLIVSKAIATDDRLPSVREMAASLAINPNTIQRAYRELEKEGYVYTISGKGTFAAPCQAVSDDRMEELLHRFDDNVLELFYMSVASDTLKGRIEKLKEGGIQP